MRRNSPSRCGWANFAPLTATGPSKKLAEHKAAEAFLIREKVWRETL